MGFSRRVIEVRYGYNADREVVQLATNDDDYYFFEQSPRITKDMVDSIFPPSENPTLKLVMEGIYRFMLFHENEVKEFHEKLKDLGIQKISLDIPLSLMSYFDDMVDSFFEMPEQTDSQRRSHYKALKNMALEVYDGYGFRASGKRMETEEEFERRKRESIEAGVETRRAKKAKVKQQDLDDFAELVERNPGIIQAYEIALASAKSTKKRGKK